MFKSLAIPTLTYGLELCTLTRDLLAKLDVEARKALKALFNVSKHSKNLLQPLFHVEAISQTLRQNKLNLFSRLLENDLTREICLQMMTANLTYPSFTNDVAEIASQLNLNIEPIVFGESSRLNVPSELPSIPEEIERQLNFCVKYWNIRPLRYHFISIARPKGRSKILLLML